LPAEREAGPAVTEKRTGEVEALPVAERVGVLRMS
jgi:hypothetical protein